MQAFCGVGCAGSKHTLCGHCGYRKTREQTSPRSMYPPNTAIQEKSEQINMSPEEKKRDKPEL